MDRTEERKKDTRRKILLGAVVFEGMAVNEKIAAWANRVLARRLTKPRDRALFGLPPAATIGIGTLAAGDDGPTILSIDLKPAAEGATTPVRPPQVSASRRQPEAPS
jgi:hypothetical protein